MASPGNQGHCVQPAHVHLPTFCVRPECTRFTARSVCLGEYEEGDVLRALLPCEHAFHAVSMRPQHSGGHVGNVAAGYACGPARL